jgi:hypothetical protein
MTPMFVALNNNRQIMRPKVYWRLPNMALQNILDMQKKIYNKKRYSSLSYKFIGFWEYNLKPTREKHKWQSIWEIPPHK